MKRLKVIINGERVDARYAGATAIEIQHELAMETGKFVRVIEYIVREPKQRWERQDA